MLSIKYLIYVGDFQKQFSSKLSFTWENRILHFSSTALAIKWLRILSIPSNDKIRNHLFANSIENGETKRMPRRVQMYIHEYLINHISNESDTILISILSVI